MNSKKLVVLSFVILVILAKGSLAASPLDSFIPKRDIPRGWTLMHGPQPYNKKSLFEHINGQAELYIKYGFQRSVFAIYQSKEKSESQIEVDIYDMGNVIQAFGVFSRFRNEDRPGDFGLDSYLDDQSALFYKGKYFVLLYAAGSDPDTLKQFCRIISSKITDTTPPPKEIRYFPKSGLKPGSIQYFSEGLLGNQFLKRGFQGTYLDGEKESHLFLAIFKDSQEAIGALKVFREDLSKKGKISSESPTLFGTKALKGEDPYKGKTIVLQKGFYLAGTIGFENEKYAEDRLGEFITQVK
jgi:hypothetical protein